MTGDELQTIIDDLDRAQAWLNDELAASLKRASELLVEFQDVIMRGV